MEHYAFRNCGLNRISNILFYFENNTSLKSWKFPNPRFLFVHQGDAIKTNVPIQLFKANLVRDYLIGHLAVYEGEVGESQLLYPHAL